MRRPQPRAPEPLRQLLLQRLRRPGDRLRPTLASAALLVISLAGAAAPTPLSAQDTSRIAPLPAGPSGWNGPRALELVALARTRRRQPVADSSLRSYRADVTGHIYFFIDREDDPEPVLLRADQVALDLYWAEPDRVKQVIRGMRSAEEFPIKDFRYYLDRYTVIQNGFDDVIRVGEGRDVRNVIHPLAAEGRIFYDFRLGDSTTIRLPGQPDPIRVYEIQVRPRDFSLPGFVGSLYLERARGDLVRLAFTFTPASYRDPRNERVEVMLENALWEGKYWLPREQRLLVRREIPEIDLDVGTVIRGALRVQNYDLNPDLPPTFFRGPAVAVAAGPERLAEYEFEEGLYDGFASVGLEGAEPGTLDDVDVDAITGRILRERFLRGVPRTRFFAPSASDVVRFDRAEGLVTGAGLTFGVGRSQAYVYGGWAWGSGEPLGRIGWRPAGPDTRPRLFAEAYLNRPRALGLRPATAGVLSSISAAALGRDYRDFVLASGGTMARRWGAGRSRTAVELSVEYVERAEQARTHAPGDEERLFRPVPAAESGTEIAAAWSREGGRPLGPARVSLRPSLQVGVFSGDSDDQPREFLRGRLDAEWGWTDGARSAGADLRLTAAVSAGPLAPHQLWYIGGPNTLPGHPFHAYVGAQAAWADVTLWRTIVPGALRVRGLGAIGWTAGGPVPVPSSFDGDGGPAPATGELEPWIPRHTGSPRASVGVGLGLLHDVIRLDYALRTDRWDGVVILSVDPSLWSFL